MLPPLLFHGSRFKQNELQPGFNHTRKIVQWDKTESNVFLYATSVRETAIELGFASSLEKIFEIDLFRVQGKEILIECNAELSMRDLATVPVYLYQLKCKEEDGWVKNDNETNGITTEYKTQRRITEIDLCEKVNIAEWLKQYKVSVRRTKHSPAIALESLMSTAPYSW
jgi:hypothetical protein